MTTYPDQTTKSNSYDGPGNLASVTDQASNVVQYTYDAANQLKSVVQVNSPNTSANTTSFNYDKLGNLSALADANSHTTQNLFDQLREMTGKTLPDGTLTESRNYDNNGNLTSLTHFNGTTTTYTYDALNRLLSRTTPGEVVVSFTYTPTGKYATSTGGDGTTTYGYDSLDRLTTKATPQGTLSYTYDAAGHVASIQSSNAGGANVSYTYDTLNRLSTVVDSRLGTTTYTYDGASNVALVTYPNNVQTQFNYDTLNRVSALATQQSGYTYQRGPTGNITSANELSNRTINWSYDGIYRLTNETVTADPNHINGSVSYGLDPVGNRLSENSSLSGVSSGGFGYNADDQVNTESYDQNGNVTATGGKGFTYDSQNQMMSMTTSGTAASMVYDAFGNRVAKTVNGITTHYLVDDLNPTGYAQVVDELAGSLVTRTYTYGLQRISQNQVVSNTWTPSFYGYDGGGSVRQLTNSAGVVTDTYDYDAFGNKINSTGTTPNNYLYRGEQYDPDLSLYYLRARYYNPLTGRFLSRDPENGIPTDPGTLQKYIYAGGDPVNLADPTGRAATNTRALGSPAGQYIGLAALAIGVAAGYDATHPGAVKALGQEIACDLTLEGSDVSALVKWAIDSGSGGSASIEQQDECHVKETSQPPNKPQRCKDLNAIVDGISQTIGEIGGSCSAKLLSPSENYARLSLWIAFLNARLDERAECSQWDPNPEGHDQKIKDIWTNIINCEVILHEFQ